MHSNNTLEKWEEKPLQDLCEIEIGKTPNRSTPKFWDKELITNNTWLSIADLNNTVNKEVFTSKERVSDIGASNIKIVKRGTLLLSFKLTIGRVAFAGKDLYTNEAIAQLPIKNKNDIDKNYLYYYLQYFNYDELLKGDVKVKGKTLNKEKLKALPVLYPEISEQQRIVGILDEAFENIEKAKQNTLQNLNNAKELFESKSNNIFKNLHTTSNNVKMSDITDLITKGASPKWQGFEYCEKSTDSILFITSENVGKEELLLDNRKYLGKEFNEKQRRSILEKGDILTNIVGASIGRTTIFDLEDVCNINQAVCLIRLKDKESAKYITKYMNSITAIESMIGMIKDCARANVSLTNIADLYVPMPNIEEQQKIVQQLDELQEQTKKLEQIYTQKLQDLDELKQSILQKAFKGEL